tara:strand:- start:3205 stop:3531 length:327 start_codon:yes stop_codon:yes gene_type:complete
MSEDHKKAIKALKDILSAPDVYDGNGISLGGDPSDAPRGHLYNDTKEGLEIALRTIQETSTKDYISALRHWATLFWEGTLSDEYADEIAYLLEDKAHDLEADLRKGNL